MSSRCKICNEIIFEWENHECDPLWLCYLPTSDSGQELATELADVEGWIEWQNVWASTAKQAAEIYSDLSDSSSADYPDTRTVVVKNEKGELFAFDVELRTEPVYEACKKEIPVLEVAQ